MSRPTHPPATHAPRRGEQASAVVFPGLAGTTFSALGKFLVLDRFARPRVRVADEVLGYSLLDRFRASADDDYSEAAQVASLISSLALAERAEELLGVRPRLCAGPSFGLRPLAVYSGSLDLAEGIRLTAQIARREREYFRTRHSDVVTHTVVRVPAGPLAELLAEWTGRGDWIEVSGDLDDGFAMISMREALLDEFKAAITAMGGYSMQTMRPPAHATVLGELREAMERDVFAGFDIRAPHITVVKDQDGSIVDTGEAMRTMLLDTFHRPFDWRAVVGALVAAGVRTIHFTGADLLFSRLDSTVRHFHVVKVDPKSALRPSPFHVGETA
ncbi:ACP S-malonyltransferase [Streptomyces sp. Rer75]|uniref:ACP S-malonyltransferase n=1 Tax=Streptomyces sp. Rer75 TaxID=2750011 RepID=UPI0015CFA40E|nr:ACP S-malonyltransferase [Streptomyces sp. Rer75]QLH19397.1 ACP S-malonyltransferase [Streptomyces sp. Rer75]